MSQSHFVTVPPTCLLEVQDENGALVKLPLPMKRYVGTLLRDDRFTTGFAAEEAAERISEAFSEVNEGDVVKLRSEDWDLLRAAINTPQGGSRRLPEGRQALVYARAIIYAEAKKPAGRKLEPVPEPEARPEAEA